MSLVAAFDERCARLSARVGRSSDALADMHRSHVKRDVGMVRALHAEVNGLRTSVDALATELQPKLERFASAEPQHALPPRFTTPPIRIEPTRQQVQAVIALQQAWRRGRAAAMARDAATHALSRVRFCPEVLRRNFVLGVRTPLEDVSAAPPALAAPPQLEAPVPHPFAIVGEPSASGGGHFMSIL